MCQLSVSQDSLHSWSQEVSHSHWITPVNLLFVQVQCIKMCWALLCSHAVTFRVREMNRQKIQWERHLPKATAGAPQLQEGRLSFSHTECCFCCFPLCSAQPDAVALMAGHDSGRPYQPPVQAPSLGSFCPQLAKQNDDSSTLRV